MMKRFFSVVTALFLSCASVHAQWQTPNHSVPLGRGAGAIGFGNVPPCSVNVPIIGQGSSADPICGAIGLGTAGVTGNLPVGNLNGGTGANSSTFWRGDATWVNPFAANTGASMLNGQVTAVATANTLVLSILTTAGATPSTADTAFFNFRSAALTSGAPTILPLQSALTFTLATTSSLGCTTSTLCRLWILASDTNGTGAGIALCAFNALNASSISPLNEAILFSSGSGTSGGTSSQLAYCSVSSVTSRPYRIVGYVEATWASGTGWTGLSLVQLFGPGIKKPGDVIQSVFNATATNGTVSANAGIPQALTNGQSLSINLSSSTNVVRGFLQSSMQNSAASSVSMQMARGSTLIGELTSFSSTAGGYVPATLIFFDIPRSTSLTYSVFGNGASGTVTIPAANAGAVLILDEIQGALEPANDNNEPVQMAG